jgi:hypothetical protein
MAAPIVDPDALKFSNEQIRGVSEQCAKFYFRAVSLITRWTANGSGAAALVIVLNDLRAAADFLCDLYAFAFKAEKTWFLGVNANFSTNDTTIVQDGSPGDSRPAATTAKCNNVITRCQEVQNWLTSATQSFTDAARAGASGYNTVLKASGRGPLTLALADAANFITRCTEFRTNYEAASSANLNTVLAMAPNPNP